MTSNTLFRRAPSLVMLVLTGAILVACGGKSASSTKPSPTPTTAECSAEECAAAAEPPISPTACGEGHEKDIGTVCKRVESTCQKVLQCAGAQPATTEAPAP